MNYTDFLRISRAKLIGGIQGVVKHFYQKTFSVILLCCMMFLPVYEIIFYFGGNANWLLQ